MKKVLLVCVCRVNPWLKPLCYTSLGVFLVGFLLWNIDNIFCETLRSDLVDKPATGYSQQTRAKPPDTEMFTGFRCSRSSLRSMK